MSPWRIELKTLLRLAAPLAVVQMGNSLMGAVDTAVAGRMSPNAMAATGLGGSVFFLIAIMGLGIVLGVDPIASQAFGAGEPRAARRAMWQGLYAAVLVAVPLWIIMIGVSTQLERFGVRPEIVPQARAFMLARAPSLLPMLAISALRSYLQAAHRAGWVLVSTIVANLVNLAGDWVLGFGDAGLERLGLPALGLPALGVAGLGLSSTLCVLGQLGVLALAVRTVPRGAGDLSLHVLDRRVVGTILKLGAPIGVTLVAEVGVFALAQILIAGIDVTSASAHQVALMLASLTFSVCLGTGAATSVEVGRAIGREDGPAARRAGVLSMLLAAGFMTCTGLVMVFFPTELSRLMGASEGTLALSVTLLRIGAVFQLADGIQAVSSGALRGAGLTSFASYANLVAHWAIGMPTGLVLAYGYHLGAAGFWWGFTAGLVAVALAMAVKFLRVTRGDVRALRVHVAAHDAAVAD